MAGFQSDACPPDAARPAPSIRCRGSRTRNRRADEPTPLAVRQAWARLIRKVYEVDPLRCPRCGGTLRVIAVIDQPDVIRQILEHLGLARPPQADRPPPI